MKTFQIKTHKESPCWHNKIINKIEKKLTMHESSNNQRFQNFQKLLKQLASKHFPFCRTIVP